MARFLLISFLFFPVIAAAQDGVFDSTFGDGGLVVTDLGDNDRLTSLALAADGGLLAAGYSGGSIVVVRYQTDGSLDEAFSETGVFRLRLEGTETSAAWVLRVLQDGCILVGGETTLPYASFLLRLNPDGTLDDTFGKDGIARPDGIGDIYDLDVLNGGDIVVAGSWSGDFITARLRSDGRPDSTFGTNGLVQTDLGYNDVSQNVIALPDGRVFTAGNQIDFDIPAFAFTRHLPDGQPDPTFGQQGLIAFPFDGYLTYAQEALLLDDGRFLVFGTDFSGAVLWRIMEDGSLDPSFGSEGSVIVSNVNAANGTPSATLDAAGRILTLARPGISIARFLPDGTQDTTFGSSGSAQGFEGFLDYPAALTLAPDGRTLIVGGYGPGDSGTTDFKLARFLVEPTVTQEEAPPAPAVLHLDAFPNPLSTSATLTIELPTATEASLRIYDVLGREVAALADGQRWVGTHTVTWTPTGLASGLYVARLEANSEVRTQRLVLAR